MKIKVTYIPQDEVIAVRVVDTWAVVTGDDIVKYIREEVDNDQYPEVYDCD